MWREAVVLSMIRFPDAFGIALGRVGALLLHGGHDFRPCFDLRLAAQLAPFFRRRQPLADQSTKCHPTQSWCATHPIHLQTGHSWCFYGAIYKYVRDTQDARQ